MNKPSDEASYGGSRTFAISAPNRLPEVIQGVEFKDGIRQVEAVADEALHFGLFVENPIPLMEDQNVRKGTTRT